MSWETIYTPSPPHVCDEKPVRSAEFVGEIIRCKECGQKWVLSMGSQYNETWVAWRRIE